MLGPFSNHQCPVPDGGVAGRLQVGEGATKLVVRYRVEAKAPDFALDPAVFTVRLATPEGATASKVRELIDPAELAPREGSTLLSTSWLTLEVPLPAQTAGAGAEVGFSIEAGPQSLSPDCIFVFGPLDNGLAVVLDEIRVE